ncbi:pyrimidine reductase [Streptomyces nanshensis]|nr:pyrimidine reductase [Streptomyces nanshensis]
MTTTPSPAPARPHVVAHVAVTPEGVTTGFEPDVGLFYELAGTWQEDVTLAGSGTLLAQEATLASAPPGPGPAADGPLLAVVDGGGRISRWEELRAAGHWSDVLALHSACTPPRPASRQVRELVTGSERVDLRAVLETLAGREGAGVVRVDSGGSLIGALLAADLLDEVSLLVHPCLAADRDGQRWYGNARGTGRALELVTNETLRDGIVWLRHRVRR